MNDYDQENILIAYSKQIRTYVGTFRVSLTVQDGFRSMSSTARFVACRRPFLLSQDSRVTR